MVNMEEGSDESRKFHQMIATVLQETRAFMEAAPAVPPWLAYLAMDNRLGGLVGNCNFKGNPSEEGEVEIGIVTFAQFERKGYGSEMARQLVDLARLQGTARRIVAMNRVDNEAGARVLQKQGFTHVDTSHDEEHGELWEWALELC